MVISTTQEPHLITSNIIVSQPKSNLAVHRLQHPNFSSLEPHTIKVAKTNKHAPGLYQKAKQQEAVKLAGGSPCNKRVAAQAKHAVGDNKDDALSDDAISTDPWTTVINYGDDNIDCDGGNNEGDNNEEVENEDEGNDDEEEAEDDHDNHKSSDENGQSN